MLGDHPIISRFMKGIFNSLPITPVKRNVWNPHTVLHFFKTDWPNRETLTLKQLSQKVTMLLLLVSAQRAQTIIALDIDQMILEETKVTFVINKLLKTSKPSQLPQPLVFHAYDHDERLCIVRHVKEYLHRTGSIRTSTQLLIKCCKPFSAIVTDTLRRWVRDVMTLAGIEDVFTPHSTRKASS